MMTVFNNPANGVKKRAIIKSLQKVKERFAEIVSADSDIGDLIQTIEIAIMSGNYGQVPGKAMSVVNGNLGDCLISGIQKYNGHNNNLRNSVGDGEISMDYAVVD